jgi:N-formylglutamate amidohydrolase
MQQLSVAAFVPAILLIIWSMAGTNAMQTSDLVTVQAGTMPLLITAPHGGTSPVPSVPQRTAGNLLQDTRTRELTESVLSRLEGRFCEKPYSVIALFHRRYIDANRVEAEAYEHPDARPHYVAYHETIRRFVEEIRGRYPQGGILLDIHGQSSGPDTIYRGTHNTRSVTQLLARYGPAVLTGPDSIFGRLQAAGFDVFPPNTPLNEPREDAEWFTGYTIRTYGSHHTDGIDAIQIENGSNLRQPGNLDRLAQQTAEAIAVFYTTYLNGQSRCG